MLNYYQIVIKILISDGWWSGWTEFGECSTSCGNGVHFRTRQCNNPAPQNGGQDCSGSSHEFKACTNGLCPLGTQTFLVKYPHHLHVALKVMQKKMQK